MKFTFVLLFISVLFLSCSEEEHKSPVNTNQTAISIDYGTSFGECLDYCISNMFIDNNGSSYKKYGWSAETDTIKHVNAVGIEYYQSYLNEDDFLTTFFTTDSIVGCPDCADGGSEWIEIELEDGSIHKVTFEYMNEPVGFTSLVVALRNSIKGSQKLDSWNE